MIQSAPDEAQRFAAVEDARYIQLEVLDVSSGTWLAARPPTWGANYRAADSFPQTDSLEDWEEWGLARLPDGIYRALWKPVDRRQTLGRRPVFRVADGEVTIVEVEGVSESTAHAPPAHPPMPSPHANAFREGPRAPHAPQPPTMPASRPSPPPDPASSSDQSDGETLATLAPVLSPTLSPGLVNAPLQQFLLVAQMAAQQSDRFIAATQAMARATIEAERERTQGLVEAVIRAQQPAAPALGPEQILQAVHLAVQPLADRLDRLEEPEGNEDEYEDERIQHLLAQLTEAQRKEPRSFLEQLTAFLSSPGGAAVAQGMRQYLTSPPPEGGGGVPASDAAE